ncbi:nucleotide sugar dehydrogenase [Sphingomonas daechungensis]|uniref:2-dehydropantoate 2-reductase N-terminal domain-containing protein n=1 Tax=Sphingomonas daechungensis TaxID=1176646 RepID=UPI00295000D6|nr:2-dehydropantoate 2-reductase N-terminal domain-containing protein [Sphingomonas daechungensis]
MGERIVVVGLGYVGLPLAVALARKFEVIGFDIDANRIGELRQNYDRTREVDEETLKSSTLKLSSDRSHCSGADVFIVTVPTPVDEQNRPDLSALIAATRIVAESIDGTKRPTIIYESTVYPGVTEGICGSEIEKASGLKRGRDFRLGYSRSGSIPAIGSIRLTVLRKSSPARIGKSSTRWSGSTAPLPKAACSALRRSKLPRPPRPSRTPSVISTSPS